MATAQVPGYVPTNQDSLHERCWAERPDRLLTVEAVTPLNVQFVERDATGIPVTSPSVMPILDFQRAYSDSGWTWHDKSPSPIAA